MIDPGSGRCRRSTAGAAAGLAGLLLVAGTACSGSPAAAPETAAPVPAANRSPATTPPATTSPAAVVPGATWTGADPATKRLQAAPLAEITPALQGTDTDCVTVVKNGEIVHESTYNGVTGETDQVVFSVSKSIMSALVGIAQEQGKLRIDQKASDFVTEWKGTPSEPVTVRQLLSMNSGRFYSFQSDYQVMVSSPDQSAYAVGLSQQYPPGEHWEYNNAGVQDLEVVLRRATGAEVPAYADQVLFGPIGATVDWVKDSVGHPWAYGGLKASCRDLARVGLLFGRGGKWGDRQVVPEAWVRQSTEPSQALNPNYGFLWWLNKPRQAGGDGTGQATATGTVPYPQLGPDAYSANGARGQYIVVSPRDDLVVVRTGRQDVGQTFKSTAGVLGFVLDKTAAAGAT